MRQLLYLPLFAFLLFSGCTYWYQEGVSFDTSQESLDNCLCELKIHTDYSPDYLTGYDIDFIKQCMRSQGYKLVTEDKLPMKVKRRAPKMSTFWVLAGTAGTVECSNCQ